MENPGKMSLEQEVELICANMKIACKENQKVYLEGSDGPELRQKYWKN